MHIYGLRLGKAHQRDLLECAQYDCDADEPAESRYQGYLQRLALTTTGLAMIAALLILVG